MNALLAEAVAIPMLTLAPGLTFDASSRRLMRDGRDVHLSPKAFDLLAALIDVRPRVLTKAELHARLWPGTFVSDVNLAGLIAEIRRALADDARKPIYLRTAHRVGYAFRGPAEATAAPPSSSAGFCWLIKDGRRLPLQTGENILGRDSQEGVEIDSATVSRRHARIAVSTTEATLEDLGSKNGTFVGGAPVSGTVNLKDGDEIRIGSVVMRFRMTAPKGATATWSGSKPDA
jgi:DNA-binding winged helix-turn-helix (wHTH) protein